MGKTTLEMTSPHKVPSPTQVRRRRGRAVNAVADYLRDHLRVPNVYLEPKSPSLHKPDVLAVDAAGSGDIHAVEVKIPNLFVTSSTNLKAYLDRLHRFPAHFRYLALPKNVAIHRLLQSPILYANNGIGRVGILLLEETSDGLPKVELAVRPERFRVNEAAMEKVERFLERSKPDIFVRI